MRNDAIQKGAMLVLSHRKSFPLPKVQRIAAAGPGLNTLPFIRTVQALAYGMERD